MPYLSVLLIKFLVACCFATLNRWIAKSFNRNKKYDSTIKRLNIAQRFCFGDSSSDLVSGRDFHIQKLQNVNSLRSNNTFCLTFLHIKIYFRPPPNVVRLNRLNASTPQRLTDSPNHRITDLTILRLCDSTIIRALRQAQWPNKIDSPIHRLVD